MKLHRGRLIDHIQLVVADIDAAKRFYKALFEVLDLPIGGEGDDHIWVDELYISTADSEAANGELTGRHHIAFQARDRATVDKWHAAGMAAGGRDNGKPGERSKYHPGYYGAFLIDPAGNNVEAVHHGEGKFSARSVEIEF